MYVEISIDEAMKRCKKNAKVLVATQDLEDDDIEVIFVTKKRNEYEQIFNDVKIVAAMDDDFVKQLNLFTEKQDIHNIRPLGVRRIIILTE